MTLHATPCCSAMSAAAGIASASKDMGRLRPGQAADAPWNAAGIGNPRDGLHPVQERLAKAHGSQCGFCTPGFVMSMYSLLRSAEHAPSMEEIEENLAGNLWYASMHLQGLARLCLYVIAVIACSPACELQDRQAIGQHLAVKLKSACVPCSRCTGYRPILDAFRVFAKADPAAYTEEAIAASKAGQQANGHANGNANRHANGTSNGHANGHSNGCASQLHGHLDTAVVPQHALACPGMRAGLRAAPNP